MFSHYVLLLVDQVSIIQTVKLSKEKYNNDKYSYNYGNGGRYNYTKEYDNS